MWYEMPYLTWIYIIAWWPYTNTVFYCISVSVGKVSVFQWNLTFDSLWLQWSCRPALWCSTRSSSSTARFFRPITSSTGATASAGGPPSSCWAVGSSSAFGRTCTRMACTETFLKLLEIHTHRIPWQEVCYFFFTLHRAHVHRPGPPPLSLLFLDRL